MVALKLDSYSWNDLITNVSDEMGQLTGNILAEKQRPMVESRMKRRLQELQLSTPEEYRDYWKKNVDVENKFLIGLLTTHFTSFFREFGHFEWLAGQLPAMIANAKAEKRTTLNFWSAACSNGQEVWSLAMWLQNHMPKLDPKMDWKILGTDIDAGAVGVGENGVYHKREIETAPRYLWEGLCARGKGDIEDWYRFGAELRKHVSFKTMNLLSIVQPQRFDMVMCRNVFIYFDQKTQVKIARDLLKCLTPEGVLITGLSESLTSYGLPIKVLHNSVYKSSTSVSVAVVAPLKNVAPSQLSLPKPLKVFCIDDSPTVLMILKKVFGHEEFELIGTAANGQEAIDKLKTLKPDVITLDLHMPVMDGTTFLKTSDIAKKIPVVIVSSVSRDDNQVVNPLFDLGVTDFVEKPTLSNIKMIGDELMQKLKMGWIAKAKKHAFQTVQSTTAKIEQPPATIIFNLGQEDLSHVMYTLKQQDWLQAKLVFVVDSVTFKNSSWMNSFQGMLPKASEVKVIAAEQSLTVSSSLPAIWVNYRHANIDIIKRVRQTNHFVITEESLSLSTELKNLSDDVTPYTSISYNLGKFLSGE